MPIDVISPDHGGPAGGTFVVITGSGFTGATSVTFNGVPGTDFTFYADTTISVLSPVHAVGVVDVTVNVGGTAVGGYTFGRAVDSISPGVSGSAGGTTETIFGYGLTGVTTVNFGGVPATDITLIDDTQLTCTIPAHAAGPVDVEVVGVDTVTGAFFYDTVNWQQVSIGYGGSNGFRDSIYDPSIGFVFVGDGGLIFTSPDAITWTARTSPSPGTQNWKAVTFAPSLERLVAVGNSGVVATSDNGGATWTARTAAENNLWAGVTWSPSLNLFVAVSQAGTHRVMTSPDGITWTAVTAAAAKVWNSIAWSEPLGLFAALAFDTNGNPQLVMTSPDGATWTLQTTNIIANTGDSFSKVIFWSEVLSAFAYWTYGDSLGGGFFSSTPVRLEMSVDGATWAHASLPSANRPERVVDAPSKGFVIGVTGSPSRYITSPDGTAWTETEIPNPPIIRFGDFAACWADDLLTLVVSSSSFPDKMMVGTFAIVGLTLTDVNPPTGLTIGGTAVTLTGSGFVDGILVNFDNIAATDIVVVSDTQITCATPAHALGFVRVTVTLPETGDFASLDDGFEYVVAGISSLDPNHGPMAGGTAVTIHGAGFVTGSTITFDGVDADDIVFVNSSTYTCTTPPHSAGPVDVVLDDFTGTFTYDPITVTPWEPPGGTGGTGDANSGIRRSPEVTIARTKNQPGTTAFEVGAAGVPPLAGQIIVVDLTEGPIFEGPALSVATTYEEELVNLKHHMEVADQAWMLNARRPFGSWSHTSVTDIVLEIIANFAPSDITTTFVAAGMPLIDGDLIFDGSLNFTDCLDEISKRADDPVYWYLNGKDLHYFETESSTDPDPITDTTPTLLKDQPVTVTEDVSQIRNRIYGKGAGSDVVNGSTPGSIAIEVSDITPFDTPGGGLAIVQGQVISYTGVRRQAQSVVRQPPAFVPTTGTFLEPYAQLKELNEHLDGNIRQGCMYRLSVVDGLGVESEMGTPFGEFPVAYVVDGVVIPQGQTWTRAPQVSEAGTIQNWFTGVLQSPFSAPPLRLPDGSLGPSRGPDLVENDGQVESGTYEYIFTIKTIGGSEGAGEHHALTVPLSVIGGGFHNGRFSVRLRFLTNTSLSGGGWPGMPNPEQRVVGIGIYRSKGGNSTDQTEVYLPPQNQQKRFYSIGTIDISSAADPSVQFSSGRYEFELIDRLSDASLSSENEHIERRTGINQKDGSWYTIPPNNTTGGQVQLTNIPVIENIGDWDVPDGAMQVRDAVAFGSSSVIAIKTGDPATLGHNTLVEIEGAGTYSVSNDTVVPEGTGPSDGVPLSIYPPLRIDLIGGEAITLHPPARKIYRAQQNNPNAWRLLVTLNDNSTTLYTDNTATNPPGIFDEPSFADSQDPDSGGQPPPGVLPPIIHYVLVGIPATGLHSITKLIPDGAAINIWEQYDDLDAQIFLAGRQGGTGIREIVITDTSLKRPALKDRITVEAEIFSMPVRTVTYATRDQKTREGRTAVFNLLYPPVVGSFLIQDVRESEIHAEGGDAPTLTPKLSVTASSVRFTLEDLLKRILLRDDDRTVAGGGSGSLTASRPSSVEPRSLHVLAADPNLIFTATGSPDRAVLADTQLTIAWTGQLSPSRGGTGTDTSAVIDGDVLVGRTSDHTWQRGKITAAHLDPDFTLSSGYDAPLTNGDPVAPEIVFDSFGDVVMVIGIPL